MFMTMLFRNVRYAVRLLRKNPLFAGASIVTLALGIGATTAVFSVVDNAFFRPLPVPDSGRLVQVYSVQQEDGRVRVEFLSDI